MLKDEVVELRRLEDDITHTGILPQIKSFERRILIMISSGMNQIRRLSKEVKEEVHDIRRIKGEVTHMKVRLKSPFHAFKT